MKTFKEEIQETSTNSKVDTRNTSLQNHAWNLVELLCMLCLGMTTERRFESDKPINYNEVDETMARIVKEITQNNAFYEEEKSINTC